MKKIGLMMVAVIVTASIFANTPKHISGGKHLTKQEAPKDNGQGKDKGKHKGEGKSKGEHKGEHRGEHKTNKK